MAALDLAHEFIDGGAGFLVATSPSALRQLASGLQVDFEDLGIELLELNQSVRYVSKLKEIEPMTQASQALAESASRKACQHITESNFYEEVFESGGFHQAVTSVWQELLSHGVTESDLEDASDTEPVLRGKLGSMAAIRKQTRELLGRLHRAWNADVMLDCIRAPAVPGNEYGRWLFLLGNDAAPLDAEFVFSVAEAGAEVWVLRDNSYELAGVADPLSAVFEERSWTSVGESPHIARLFQHDHPPLLECSARVFAAPDLLTEAEMAVRNAKQARSKGGTVAIYARDIEKFAPLLQSAATRLETALALPRKQRVDTLPNIQYFLKILRACKTCDPHLLASQFEGKFSDLGQEQIKELTDLFKEWSKLNKDVQRSESDSIPWAGLVWDWAATYSQSQFSKRDWLERIQELGCLIPWASPLTETTRQLCEREERAKIKMMSVLSADASIESLQSPAILHFGEMLSWVETSLRKAEMTHPWDPSGIEVWDQPAQISPVDDLIVIGLSEGSFPRKYLEDPVLNDEERRILSHKCGLIVDLDTTESLAKLERVLFIQLLSSAKSRLTLSYASYEDERTQLPARYLTSFLDWAKSIKVEIFTRQHGAIPTTHPLTKYESKVVESFGGKEGAFPQPVLSPAVKEGLSALAAGPWAIPVIRRLRRCAFQAFANDLLKVHPADFYAKYQRLFDIPRDVGLVGISDESEARGRLQAAYEEFLDVQGPTMPHWEVSMIRCGWDRLFSGWLHREFTARRLWRQSATDIEAPFELTSPRENGVTAKVAGKYRLNGLTVLIDYQSAAFEGVGKSLNGETSYDVVPMLLAALQVNRMESGQGLPNQTEAQFGLEIDSSNSGTRHLATSVLTGLPGSAADGLTVSSSDLDTNILGSIKEAAQSLKQWASDIPIHPSPGPSCRNCGFGELCRHHESYGDSS